MEDPTRGLSLQEIILELSYDGFSKEEIRDMLIIEGIKTGEIGLAMLKVYSLPKKNVNDVEYSSPTTSKIQFVDKPIFDYAGKKLQLKKQINYKLIMLIVIIVLIIIALVIGLMTKQ